MIIVRIFVKLWALAFILPAFTAGVFYCWVEQGFRKGYTAADEALDDWSKQ
jgi:hypothetical protein